MWKLNHVNGFNYDTIKQGCSMHTSLKQEELNSYIASLNPALIGDLQSAVSSVCVALKDLRCDYNHCHSELVSESEVLLCQFHCGKPVSLPLMVESEGCQQCRRSELTPTLPLPIKGGNRIGGSHGFN